MSEKEYALYLYNAMQTRRIKSLTKCIDLGQQLNKEVSAIAGSRFVSEEVRQKCLQFHAEVVRSLDAELEVITQINTVVMAFAEYIEALPDTFDKEIMVSRYFHGYQWSEIEKLTGKSERTVLRRHKKRIREYMVLNNIT
ncbi:MAG: sigma-70 family RNA polymerase sigma factor [Ruminiclostridium sp.]|nr:sigma-70 family RNA polymerase sigma factor [Ruminiclostridium sp.]